MKSIYSPEYARNYGFWNEHEQRAIMAARVAIAGVGGDGFQLGLKLAMKGVAKFDIADPEVFEPENANRVPGATVSTYGRKKAEVFAERVHDINPYADVRIFDDGVTPDNVQDFVSKADIVFDESELTYMQIGTSVARAARERGIPDVMVMNIGFAATVTSFHPASKHTFERFMGIPKGMPLDEIKDLSLNLDRCIPYLPHYGDVESLAAVQSGAPLPSIAEGVDIASGIGATQGFLHIVSKENNKRPNPIWAPKVAYIDGYSMKAGVTRYPRASHYRHLAVMATRHYLGQNPKASYSTDNRQSRSDALAQQDAHKLL